MTQHTALPPGPPNGNVDVYWATTDPAPRQPVGVEVAGVVVGIQSYPKITWDPNLEPSVIRYDLWRKMIGNNSPPDPPGAWTYLASKAYNEALEYIDFGAPGIGGPAIARYMLRAVDSWEYQSTFSDSVSINWGNPPIGKFGSGTHGPQMFDVSMNYPNPFNPSTEIMFDLPEAGMVSLVIYDLLGTKVCDLSSGYHEAGQHSVAWNASHQASGMYFARFDFMDAQGNVKYAKVNKLVLMK